MRAKRGDILIEHSRMGFTHDYDCRVIKILAPGCQDQWKFCILKVNQQKMSVFYVWRAIFWNQKSTRFKEKKNLFDNQTYELKLGLQTFKS